MSDPVITIDNYYISWRTSTVIELFPNPETLNLESHQNFIGQAVTGGNKESIYIVVGNYIKYGNHGDCLIRKAAELFETSNIDFFLRRGKKFIPCIRNLKNEEELNDEYFNNSESLQSLNEALLLKKSDTRFSQRQTKSNVRLGYAFTIQEEKAVRDYVMLCDGQILSIVTKKRYDLKNVVILYNPDNTKYDERSKTTSFHYKTLFDMVESHKYKYFFDHGENADILTKIQVCIDLINDEIPIKRKDNKKKNGVRMSEFNEQNVIKAQVCINNIQVYPSYFIDFILENSILFNKKGFKDGVIIISLPDLSLDVKPDEIDMILKMLFRALYNETFPSVRELLKYGSHKIDQESDVSKTLYIFRIMVDYLGIDLYPQYIDRIMSML